MSNTPNFGRPQEGSNGPIGSPQDSKQNAQAKLGAQGSANPERRGRRRALVSAPVRVRGLDVTVGPSEISTTLDVSRSGFLYVSSQDGFTLGMDVAVVFPYSKSPSVPQAEQFGRVARITQMADGRRAIAIAIVSATPEAAVEASGRVIAEATAFAKITTTSPTKPLILAVDADPAVRSSLKAYLSQEGYEVIAVGSTREAHEVLHILTPALLIAEIEGADLPGFELCVHVKATARLRTIPVVLMTSSAYPSDYANAHSLGAVVCMAKPYRQERLGHVVRLLVPTPEAKEQTGPARQADPKRRTPSRHAGKSAHSPRSHRRHRP